MKTSKLPLIISAVIAALILLCIVTLFSARNNAINLEETVLTAQADINTEEKRRVDLVYNLADAVKSYNSYESEALSDLAESMSENKLSDQAVDTSINAIVYNYPELKSNENYKQFMQELTITENLISQHREAYNNAVAKYNRYVKSFPANIWLSITGYDVNTYERTQFEVSEDAPTGLLGDD